MQSLPTLSLRASRRDAPKPSAAPVEAISEASPASQPSPPASGDAVPSLALKKTPSGALQQEAGGRRRFSLFGRGSKDGAQQGKESEAARVPEATTAQGTAQGAGMASPTSADSGKRPPGLWRRTSRSSVVLSPMPAPSTPPLASPSSSSSSIPSLAPAVVAIPSARADYDALVWAQVADPRAAADERVTLEFAALPLRAGQLVLVLELGTKERPLCLGLCNGALGQFHRSAVKLVDEADVSASPSADDASAFESLLSSLMASEFVGLRLLLDCLPPSKAPDCAACLLDTLRWSKMNARGLLKTLIRHEVANTREHQMLLRGNTVASKVISQFAKQHGTRYLEQLLRPLLSSMHGMTAAELESDFAEPSLRDKSAESDSSVGRSAGQRKMSSAASLVKGKKKMSASPGAGLDEDADEDQEELSMAEFLRASLLPAPHRTAAPLTIGQLGGGGGGGGGAVTDSDDSLPDCAEDAHALRERNQEIALSIWASAEMVLEQMMGSFNDIPPALRAVAHDLYTLGSAKFADSTSVLSGFFILRFVGPSIASPDPSILGNVSLTGSTKKRLLQVSKVLMAIANSQPFKEGSHLDTLNERVLSSGRLLKGFFALFKDDVPRVDTGVRVQVADLDRALSAAFWRLCLNCLPAMARRAAGSSSNSKEMVAFLRLVDVVSGPIVGKLDV